MAQNYVVLKTDFSNGFPYPTFYKFDNLEEARKMFDDLKITDDSMGNSTCKDTDVNFIDRIFYYEENMSGNGTFLGLITEDDMLQAIRNKIDSGEDYTTMHCVAETDYDIQCPKFDAKWDRLIYCENKDTYLDFVVRRPEDLDNPNNGEYVYDVHTKDVTEDNDTEEFVESLECVEMEILVDLFNEMFL